MSDPLVFYLFFVWLLGKQTLPYIVVVTTIDNDRVCQSRHYIFLHFRLSSLKKMLSFQVMTEKDRREAAAIERRRALEEERKKRIFNPHSRLIGVSISGSY